TALVLLLQAGTVLGHFLPLPNRTLASSLERRSWPGTCDGSDSTKTQKCLDAYFKGWGFDLPKDTAPAYYDFALTINNLMKQYGDAGWDFYCEYEWTLERCLGNLINTPCVNAESFSEMYFDLGTIDSVDYAINIPSGAFACKNKELVKKHQGCYKDAEIHHLDDFATCTITLDVELKDAKDRCVPFSNYSNCVTNIYVGSCGEEVKSFSCNLEEIKLGIDASACKGKLPDCSI
ncbi:hypothetical protein PENTCL1PPCAC_16747, partial [Pristionchus entomophagus]